MSPRFDISDPAFLADPGPSLAALRAAGPLAPIRLPLIGTVYATTTDAATRALLKDPRFVRDPRGRGPNAYWFLPRFMAPLMRNMLMTDGPEHARLRGLVSQAFARHSIEDMRSELTAMAEGLLGPLPSDAPVDIVAAYCRPLPLLAICAMLGLSEEDRVATARMTAPLSGISSVWGFVRALPGLAGVMRHFRRLIAEAREAPRPGLLSELVQARDGTDGLTDDELLAMVVTLFLAGHETTVHLAGDAILTLADHPEDRRRLAGDPSAIPTAVEEALRFMTPVMMTKMLFPTEPLEFEGVALRPGDKVVALLVAANHDPARVEAPDEFRSDRRPNPHMGFGHGPHVCLGMQLARLETAVMIETMLRTRPAWRLAVSREATRFKKSVGLRGLAELPVVLGDPAPRA